jgi:hypothetical protein
MTRRIFASLALVIAVLATTFGQAPTMSFAQQPTGAPVPLVMPGIPTDGPLSPAAFKARDLPQMSISAVNDAFNADLAKTMKSIDPSGKYKQSSVELKKVAAGIKATESLKKSLTAKQQAALANIVSSHQGALQNLIVPVKVVLDQAKSNPQAQPAQSLAEAQNLSSDLQAWKASLDADIAKVLTKQQMQLYRASNAKAPALKGGDAVVSSSCGYCYSAYYYGYYGELYSYYGYVYAYYGYISSPYSYNYDYYAYVYSYNGYNNAVTAYNDEYNAYYYDDIIDAAYAYYYAHLAYDYEYYGYVYAYYAYYYLTDHSGANYYYYSYTYNYYGQYYDYNGYYYAYYNLASYMVAP